MSKSSITRRELFRAWRRARQPARVSWRAERAAQAQRRRRLPSADRRQALQLGVDIYQAIGVRPLINARGTFTIISGSTMLPEVRAAMDAAAQKYVHLDELTEAVGARLATLTGAEWGMVSNGCSAGLTLATAACVAGGNPGSARPAAQPERLSRRTKPSSRPTRATSTMPRFAPSACGWSRCRRSRSSRRRSARGPR